MITYQHLKQVMEAEEGLESHDFIITPYHLFKYKSLRSNTLLCSFIFMLVTYLYYGPVIIVDKLGINLFASQVIMSISELCCYPICLNFIFVMPRVRTGNFCFGLALLLNGILIFVNPQADCQNCLKGVIEIILMFGSRLVISLFFTTFFLYVTEIFPQRARGQGLGIVSAAGALASSSGQFIFRQLEDRLINPMILFTIFCFFSLITLNFMPETHEKPLEDEIKEIE